MLQQEESTHNISEMSNKSCSNMWEPQLWFSFNLHLKLPHLKPKQEPLEYGLLMDERKVSSPFLLLQVVSKFLSESNLSCWCINVWRISELFLSTFSSLLFSLFVSAIIVYWINLKFNNYSDQLNMAYLLLKEGRKQIRCISALGKGIL